MRGLVGAVLEGGERGERLVAGVGPLAHLHRRKVRQPELLVPLRGVLQECRARPLQNRG